MILPLLITVGWSSVVKILCVGQVKAEGWFFVLDLALSTMMTKDVIATRLDCAFLHV